MAISVQKSNQLKSIAILMLLFTHLFNRDYVGNYEPIIFIAGWPLPFVISLFTTVALPIFAFVSGYGLYYSYSNNQRDYFKKNVERAKNIYTRYWLILILFAVILGLILNKEGYPGDLTKFLLNFTAIDPSYNSAWWFFTIYILFIFTSQFWFKLFHYLNPFIYIGLLVVFYLVAFYFRIYNKITFESAALNLLNMQFNLYFATLFQFMLGSFALRYNWVSKFESVFSKIKHPAVCTWIGILLLIALGRFISNSIIIPFVSLAFIFLFLQLKFSVRVENILDYFNPHSTNLWLVHSFFYAYFFRDFITAPKYALPIFLWLVLWTLMASYVINFIYNKLFPTR